MLIRSYLEDLFQLKFFHNDIQRIKSILLENEYSTKILNSAINNYLEKKITYLPNYNLKGQQVYLSLPTGFKKSEILKVKIKGLVYKLFPQI